MIVGGNVYDDRLNETKEAGVQGIVPVCSYRVFAVNTQSGRNQIVGTQGEEINMAGPGLHHGGSRGRQGVTIRPATSR